MRSKRVLVALGVALGVLAIVPVASALEGGGVPFAGGRDIQAATALSTGFTYQGRLTDAGSPANAAYDFRFILYDSETGGGQVGTVIALKDDVQVVNGLFSVDLDFGASAFNGDARWLEIAVRPGSSSGTYTVLSPRQPVSAAPYALYAKAAGTLALPFANAASSPGVTGSSAGLLTITQSGTGIAVSGQRISTDASDFPAVVGTNSGGGAAVQGISSYPAGVGGKFTGATSIEIDGPLKVSGLARTAFSVGVILGPTTTCLADRAMVINQPAANGDANAMLFVTQVYDAPTPGTAKPVAVIYNPAGCAIGAGKWALVADAAFTGSEVYNVLVVKQ
jgi:hypothetical protein